MTEPVKSTPGGPKGGREGMPAEYLARDQLPRLVRDTAPQDLAAREREILIQEYQIKQLQVQNVRAGTQIFVQLLMAVGLLVLVSLLVWMVWGAMHADSVVVDDFHAPADLERRGVSGAVIASDLFDQMQQIQEATRPIAVQQNVKGGWTKPIRLNASELGALGGFGRYIRQWLGHETYISGEVIQDGEASLRLTVRGTGITAKSFNGKTDALPALTQAAAEYVFELAQPLMFATWLTQNARDADVVAMMQTAYGHAPLANRPALLNVWGAALDNLGQTDAALEKYKLSIKVKPDYWPGYASLTDLQMRLGEEEAALQTGLTLERLSQRGAAGGGKANNVDYRYADLLRMNLPALRDTQSQSLAAGTDPSEGTASVHRPPSNAEVLARLHADKQAELELQTAPGAGVDPYAIAEAAYVRGSIALSRNDFVEALAQAQILEKMLRENRDLEPSFVAPLCWFGLTYGMGGRADAANAAFDKGGKRVDCYRFRGDVDDRNGDWPKAQRDYADAIALAPSLPSAYESWAEAQLRHHDVPGAIARFVEANKRGPNWADPLEKWGEALALQGKFKEAADKYAAAANLAPSWGHLYFVWGQALEGQGQHDRAKQKFVTAMDLDLSPTDRALATAAMSAGP